VTRPEAVRALTWLQRWGFALGLGVVLVIAVSVRLTFTLRTPGGLFGLGNYDDGVHFAAALGLINGRLPYRDFLLLHPPGVVLALAPFAALSWVIGEPNAVAVARLSWMVLGGLNAVLCALALRPVGRVAAWVGALFYALSMGAVYVEYTMLLEPPATTVLLLALVVTRLLSGSGTDAQLGVGPKHYLVAGVLLGLSPVLKIWGVVTVLVVVGGILMYRGRRPALQTLSAAVATSALLCLPFFLAAPTQMWRMVVVAQLGRRRGDVPLLRRLNDILGVRLWVNGQHTWHIITVVLLITVLTALAICLVRTELRVVGALLLANGAIVMITPMWFMHYAGLTAAPIALAIGGAAGTLITWTERAAGTAPAPWVSGVLGSLVLIGIVVLAAPLSRFHLGNAAFPGRDLAAQLANRPGCTATDWPMALLQTDALQRNLDRGCRLVVDVGGYNYYSADGTSSEVSRRRSKGFQIVILDYYRSADTVFPVRFSTRVGYSKSTARTIQNWPVIAQSGRFVIREPRPAAQR
jgi:alpha-1,2-mannosyltransferase